jgi:peptide/nickel transport system ATP-binding protein
VVMYQGNIVEQGNVQTIMLHPSHPYTQALLACRPELHRRGDRLPVVADFLGNGYTAKSVYPTAVVKGKDTDLTGTIPSSGSLLEVKHLSVWFPEHKSFTGRVLRFSRAVDDVSFAVQRGETLGLVGESGCGKTTLSRALLRLIEPTSGEIIFNGHNWLQYPPATLRSSRKQLQIIFQDPYSALNPSITVGNALMEVLRVHYPQDPVSASRRRVADLLAKVGLLPEHANRYPHAFSGGQRQRVVIARALATSPSFLICDESVSALDVSVQAQVLNLLNDLKKEFGFTIIFISHNLSVVHYISDRIMVMQQGKIVETGTADQVYHHPTEAYTRRLIAAIPEIPAAAGSRRQDFLQHPGTLP